MPTKTARPPPYKHDISHKFQLADSHNLGGHGCFNAGVFIVKRISTGENAVQKRYKTEDIRNGTAEFEMRVMQKYSHDNIVEYLCGFVDETTHHEPVASVFMEYCDEGNVNDVLKEHFKLDQPMAENKVWHIATGLVNAVAFLQYGVRDACFNPEPPKPNWTGVLHRDIKPDNIFLCSQPGELLPRVVLGDFGQGYLVNDDGKWGRQYMFGNTSTAPPEVNAGGLCAYTFAGDVYAVGATIRIICEDTTQAGLAGFPFGSYYSDVLTVAISDLTRAEQFQRPRMDIFGSLMPELQHSALSRGSHHRFGPSYRDFDQRQHQRHRRRW